MKKLLLAGLMLLSLNLLSQSFVHPANSWSVILSYYGGGNTELFVFNGDTIISTQMYKKIYVSYDSLKNLMYDGAVREQDHKVFFVLPNSATEALLYDFNPQIGQTLQFWNRFSFSNNHATATVSAIDTVVVLGTSRKRIYLSDVYQQTEIWIEGIGSLSGPLYSCFWQNIVCPHWELLCMHNNDQPLYMNTSYNSCYYSFVDVHELTYPQALKLFPNPVSKGSEMLIIPQKNIQRIEIYSITGKLLQKMAVVSDAPVSIKTNDLAPGIYLLHGIGSAYRSTNKFHVVN
jgi:hypothetical protein